MNSAWWKTERHSVINYYSGARFIQRANVSGETVGVWKLTMDHVPIREEVALVLGDLEEGNLVSIGANGKIAHLPECDFDHDQERNWSAIRLINRRIEVELEYPTIINGEVGPVHPKFRVLSPGIIGPNHPHLYFGNNGKDIWACPIAPHETTWDWEHGGTRGYLDHCAIWLLKAEVWTATGGKGLLSMGRWFGPDAGHEPLEVLNQAKLDGPCPCGRGKAYRNCHHATDINSAFVQRLELLSSQ